MIIEMFLSYRQLWCRERSSASLLESSSSPWSQSPGLGPLSASRSLMRVDAGWGKIKTGGSVLCEGYILYLAARFEREERGLSNCLQEYFLSEQIPFLFPPHEFSIASSNIWVATRGTKGGDGKSKMLMMILPRHC